MVGEILPSAAIGIKQKIFTATGPLNYVQRAGYFCTRARIRQAGRLHHNAGPLRLIGTPINHYLFFHGLHDALSLVGDVALHAAKMTDNGAQTFSLCDVTGVLQLIVEVRRIGIYLQLQQFK